MSIDNMIKEEDVKKGRGIGLRLGIYVITAVASIFSFLGCNGDSKTTDPKVTNPTGTLSGPIENVEKNTNFTLTGTLNFTPDQAPFVDTNGDLVYDGGDILMNGGGQNWTADTTITDAIRKNYRMVADYQGQTVNSNEIQIDAYSPTLVDYLNDVEQVLINKGCTNINDSPANFQMTAMINDQPVTKSYTAIMSATYNGKKVYVLDENEMDQDLLDHRDACYTQGTGYKNIVTQGKESKDTIAELVDMNFD